MVGVLTKIYGMTTFILMMEQVRPHNLILGIFLLLPNVQMQTERQTDSLLK